MVKEIVITEVTKRYKEKRFLDGAFVVKSRSGLHPTEELLIERMGAWSFTPKRLLIAGNRTGVSAMIAAERFPACEVVCHAFDLHHARAMQRNLEANGYAAPLVVDPYVEISPPFQEEEINPSKRRITVACTSALPEGPYDAALFLFTHGLMTAELALDQLESIHGVLTEGGVCEMAAEGDSGPLIKQDKQVFGNCQVRVARKGISCVSMTKRGAMKKPRTFFADFEASLPGCESVTLRSLPGVFCHRRPDMGGLALAEVARMELKPDLNVLDMGCGCGLVGCLLATAEPSIRLTFVDSHARALAAVAWNAKQLGLKHSRFVLADEGYVRRGYDLFVGNPPYYSDYQIADLFLETAWATLHRGGVCMMVAKTARALVERQRQKFGSVTALSRRGYDVLRSVRAGRC